MKELKKGTSIQSLQIGFSIVELVAFHGQPMTFTEIFESTKITKSNLYKYLNTLTHLGLLYRDKAGLYSLGSKLIEYGMAAVSRENVIDRVSPYLQEINRHCKQTALFAAWTYNGPMVVKIANNNEGLNIGAQIGSYLPILSANGKVFAAFMPPAEIAEWKQRELEKIGPQRLEELEAECELVRRYGISFANEPLVPSISSVAVPIFNYKKQLLGAITLVGFTGMIPKDVNNVISQYLLKVSLEISQGYGYEPNS
jgi:DNA-binding IclR family transcriptional regulator